MTRRVPAVIENVGKPSVPGLLPNGTVSVRLIPVIGCELQGAITMIPMSPNREGLKASMKQLPTKGTVLVGLAAGTLLAVVISLIFVTLFPA
ncbi:MAG: hypothetical protein OXH11_10080 [Candidatus Aminicenantes bacterium]|nr:hypothetical protein [Candidatus Aminicenantes bacterium]